MITVGTILAVMLVTVTMVQVLVWAAEAGSSRLVPTVSGALGLASVVGWVWAIQAAGSAVVP